MSYIQSAYINALLADAAYIDLPVGAISRDQWEDPKKGALSKRMTLPLAKFIADNFEVINTRLAHDIPVLDSGFDAIVWKGRKGTPYEGKVFLSARGTESGTDMLIADVDLTINSLARSQAIDMINWWSRITTERGKPALQVGCKNRYVYDEHAGHDIFIGREFVLAPAVQGEGLISAEDLARGVQVNGHSLGGHLASVFARIFGKQTHIEHVSTFNSAGFAPDSDAIFQQLQGLLPQEYGLPSFPDAQLQSNYFAGNGINVTTNSFYFNQVGRRISLFQEEGTGLTNHYMYRLTDMLALGNALEKLAPDLSIEALNQIISSGSHIAKGSLEGVLDAVRHFIYNGFKQVIAAAWALLGGQQMSGRQISLLGA